LGKTFYGEYVFPFNDYIALSPRIIFGNTTNSYNSISNEGTEFEFYTENYDLATSIVSAIALKFTPFPKTFDNFKVDFGLAHHKWSNVYGQKQTGFNSNENIVFRTRSTLGFIGSLNYLLVNNQTTEFGIRADMITGYYGKSLECESIQAGFFLGFKIPK
jgi:hypothetical protein